MQAPGLFDVADPRGKYGLVHNVSSYITAHLVELNGPSRSVLEVLWSSHCCVVPNSSRLAVRTEGRGALRIPSLFYISDV
jgi:hypothetical protein